MLPKELFLLIVNNNETVYLILFSFTFEKCLEKINLYYRAV